MERRKGSRRLLFRFSGVEQGFGRPFRKDRGILRRGKIRRRAKLKLFCGKG